MDTNGVAGGAPANGIARMWIDGVLLINDTTVNFSDGNVEAKAGIARIDFHENQSSVTGGPYFVDYDDIAIYKVTPPNKDPGNAHAWIGPLNEFSGAGTFDGSDTATCRTRMEVA